MAQRAKSRIRSKWYYPRGWLVQQVLQVALIVGIGKVVIWALGHPSRTAQFVVFAADIAVVFGASLFLRIRGHKSEGRT